MKPLQDLTLRTLLSPLSWVTLIALGIIRLLNLFPYPINIKIGKSFGHLLYLVEKRRSAIARKNLALCLPELSNAEREEIALSAFRNFGASIFETAMSWWANPKKLAKLVEYEGKEHLERALAQNKGVLLLGAHFSLIDLPGVLLNQVHPVYAIYRNQTNLVFNHFMIKARNRNLRGIIPHTSMRSAAKTIKQGNIVWYAPDQDMGIDHSVFADFFGHPAATLISTGKLARLTGAPVVMMVPYRKPDDSGYVIEFLEGPKDFPSGDDVQDATVINKLLESGIRRAPNQYYWFHRRFKTQPDQEKASIYK